MPSFDASTVALITASSAGLGAACARTFASAGARVVVNYAGNRERAEALVEELTELRSKSFNLAGAANDTSLAGMNRDRSAVAINADVTTRSEIVRLVDETVAQMGRLDVVVSNQGWTRFRDFLDLDDNVDDEDWDTCFRVNVKSHLWLMHASKRFLEASDGAFVSTGSLAGVVPSGSSLAYSVTKAAQIHLAKSLAIICSPHVRVNSVSPGILLTEWGKKFPEEKLGAAREKAKLKRLATVEDVAATVLLLAQSRSTTGTNAIVDAGWRL